MNSKGVERRGPFSTVSDFAAQNPKAIFSDQNHVHKVLQAVSLSIMSLGHISVAAGRSHPFRLLLLFSH